MKQPSPSIVDGGDCGACVLAGVFNLTVEEAYDDLLGKRDAVSYQEMHGAIYESHHRKLCTDFVDEVPLWINAVSNSRLNVGAPSWMMSLQWFDYIKMAIQAGYYGVASVDFDKTVVTKTRIM